MAKKLATAIDIGTSSVKVVQLENTSSGIEIVNFGLKTYPRSDADTEISDEIIVETLSELLSQAKIKPKYVAISIPRALVTAKKLNFHTQTSALTDEEISEMVALQAEVEIPFGTDNAIYNHHNVQKSAEGISVELVAARQETIEQYINILKSADLQINAILPSTYAISSLALNQLVSNQIAPTENSEERSENTRKPKALVSEANIMVIDIGAEYTDLCILRGNRVAFSRSFPIGGDLLTKAYAQEQGLSFEEAEEYKISNASLEGDSLVERNEIPSIGAAAPTYEWASRLSAELQRSIQAFGRDLLGAETVDNIWMCGRSAIIPGLEQYITERLGIPTKLWNPLATFEPNLSEEPPEKLRYSLAVSLGLALNTFTNLITVNLLPAEELQRKEKAKQRLFTLSYAAAALIMIIGISVGVNTLISSRNAKLEDVNAKLQKVQRVSQQNKRLITDDLVMTEMLSPRVSPLDILKELSEQFPDRTKIAFTNFNLDRNQKVILNVEANSHTEISNIISKLGRSELFTDVKSGQISTTQKQKGKQILQAQITCKLSDNADKHVTKLKDQSTLSALKQTQSTPQELQDEGVMKRTSMKNAE